MFSLIYNYIYYITITALLVFVGVMLLRLIFSYADPNPFGSVGRFASWLRKKTDFIVLPFADFLGAWRIDRRFAPLLGILIYALAVWAGLQFVFKILFMLNGIIGSAANANISSMIGYLLSGLIAIYSFFVLLRIFSTWILSYTSKLRRFLARITDPILIPFRRLIPPIGGMFDVSPIVVMILLGLMQVIVERLFINSPVPF